NNSCAYDASFTILFNLWCSDINFWTDELCAIGNQFIIDLVNGFVEVNSNFRTIESVRDDVRRKLEIFNPRDLQFGHFAAIDDVFKVILGSEAPVRTSSYICANNHVRRLNSHSNFVVMSGARSHISTSSWASGPNEETAHLCHRCGYEVYIKHEFLVLPSILVFDFSGHHLNIDPTIQITHNGSNYRFRLAGIIYFGQAHFISQIILQDGQVWLHDGITTGRNMTYKGLITPNPADLYTSENKTAVCAIYIKD
ncbi:hypothetical protein GALMADRAFT_81092, partial [Galerina marginata CBS 339.88]